MSTSTQIDLDAYLNLYNVFGQISSIFKFHAEFEKSPQNTTIKFTIWFVFRYALSSTIFSFSNELNYKNYFAMFFSVKPLYTQNCLGMQNASQFSLFIFQLKNEPNQSFFCFVRWNVISKCSTSYSPTIHTYTSTKT